MGCFPTAIPIYFYHSPYTGRMLQPTLLVIGIIGTIGHNDMIHEVDAHELAGLSHSLGELVVHFAGTDAVAGMVVAESQHGGVAKHSLTDDNTHVDSGLGDASMRDAHSLDELEVLIHHQRPGLLHI